MQTHQRSITGNHSITALAAVMALAAGCGVEANDGTEANDGADTADVAQANLTPPRCPGVPAPWLTSALVLGGLQVGTWGTASSYGSLCSPSYVIETTNTLGAANLDFVATGSSDDAMNRSSLACGLASITVQAWGCTSVDSAGTCQLWADLGTQTKAGRWVAGSDSILSTCFLSASLTPTVAGSPYATLRLGGKASKKIVDTDNTWTTVQLPIAEHIGYQGIR